MNYFLLFFILSCSTGVIKIRSTPSDAQVTVIKSDDHHELLGATPFEGERKTLFSPNSTNTFIRISKPGFLPKEVLLSGPGSSEVTELTVSLEEQGKDQRGGGAVDLERFSKLMLKSLGLIHSKKYEESHRVLDLLILGYPTVSAAYDLKGNVFYLQQNYPKALENYQHALALNSENRESAAMVEKLKTILK